MRAKLSSKNPFGITPKGLAFELVGSCAAGGDHLDYGTYDGEFVAALGRAGYVRSAIGVDVNAEVVGKNTSRMPGNVRLQVIKKNAPLEFAPQSFDSISIIGVVEHVHDQKRLLRQLAAALKDDGIMIVAVPGKHLLSFLDMGNFKFRFPRLHRIVYSWRYSKEQYRSRYIECANGLFGDIEVEKKWHEHFSRDSMNDLLQSVGLEIVNQDGFGFFQRALTDLAFFLGGRRGIWKRLIDCDAKLFHSTELVFIARKRQMATQQRAAIAHGAGR
jgi:SAM-dependent methyltransferase